MKLENGLRAHLANRCFLNIDIAKIWLTPPPRFGLFGDEKYENATRDTE